MSQFGYAPSIVRALSIGAGAWVGLTLMMSCSSTTKTNLIERDSAAAGAAGMAGAGGASGGGGTGGGVSEASAGTGGGAGNGAGGATDAGSDADAARDAPAGPCAGTCGTPGCGPCPSAGLVSASGYSIAGHEVTVSEYEAFLAVNPSLLIQPSYCSWNASYVPTTGWPVVGRDSHPVSHVDWCDAWAYCRWAGRRLCGRVGGGPNGYNEYGNAAQSEWYAACSAGGTLTYPYGSTYSGTTCNSQDYGAGSAVPVGSAVSCEGGLPGLFDMSGNVYEWDSACANETGGTDSCRVRGGSYAFVPFGANLRCDNDFAVSRSTTLPDLGIRCCAD